MDEMEMDGKIVTFEKWLLVNILVTIIAAYLY